MFNLFVFVFLFLYIVLLISVFVCLFVCLFFSSWIIQQSGMTRQVNFFSFFFLFSNFYSQTRSCVNFINRLMNSFMEY